MSTSLRRVLSAVVALIAALCLCGCGPSITLARVQHVKRVAIVSFDGGDGDVESYASLGSHLSSAMGWEVLPVVAVASNPEVTRILRGGGQGWSGAMSQERGLPGLFSFTHATMLDAAERAALVKGLSVDAIAVARLYFYNGSSTSSVDGLSLGSGGARVSSHTSSAFSAGVQFYLYDREGLIWSDLQAKGSETREGRPDEAPVLRREATESSYAALIERYHEAAR